MPLMDIITTFKVKTAAVAAGAVIGAVMFAAPASAAQQSTQTISADAPRETIQVAMAQERGERRRARDGGGRRDGARDRGGRRDGARNRGGRNDGARDRGGRQGADRNRNRDRRADNSGRRDGADRNRGGRRDADRNRGRRDADRNRSRDRRADNRNGRRDQRYRDRGRARDAYRDGRRDQRRADRRRHRIGSKYSHPRVRYGGRHFRHGHGPRRGHGYWCSTHSIFHYRSGYDPFGWLFVSFGWDLYPSYLRDDCDVVSQTFYRRGRRYEEVALLCYDAWGYGYIRPGSRRVYRTY